MKRWTPLLTPLLTIVLIAVFNALAIACPLCKDSVPNSDAQSAGNVANGMNNSVYFMLVGFFVVLGLITGIVVKGVRDTNNHGGRGFPM